MLFADHATLSAAAEVAGRQPGHLRATDDFIASRLSRLDAFGGVLSLFRGQYAAALEQVQSGLAASATRAEAVCGALVRCQQEYADVDVTAADLLGLLGTDVGDLDPVVPAGAIGLPPPPGVPEGGGPGLPTLQLPLDEEVGNSPTMELLAQARDAESKLADLRNGLDGLADTLDDVERYRAFETAS